MKEITWQELNSWQQDAYALIDIRDEGLRTYGMIPGAIPVDPDADGEEGADRIAAIPKEKKLVFYCEIGRRTREFDEDDFEGRDCYSLEGGYLGYVRSGLTEGKEAADKQQKA